MAVAAGNPPKFLDHLPLHDYSNRRRPTGRRHMVAVVEFPREIIQLQSRTFGRRNKVPRPDRRGIYGNASLQALARRTGIRFPCFYSNLCQHFSSTYSSTTLACWTISMISTSTACKKCLGELIAVLFTFYLSRLGPIFASLM